MSDQPSLFDLPEPAPAARKRGSDLARPDDYQAPDPPAAYPDAATICHACGRFSGATYEDDQRTCEHCGAVTIRDRSGERGGPVPPNTLATATAQVEAEQVRASWLAWLRKRIIETIDARGEYHADDLADVVGMPTPNLLGIAVNQLLRQGVIESTGEHRAGKAPASHGRRSYVYRRPWPAHLRDDAPSWKCDTCGRITWAREDAGNLCRFPQPDGTRCSGRFPADAHDA